MTTMTENMPGGQAGEASVRDQAEGDEEPGTVSPQDEGSGPQASQDPVEGAPDSGAA